MTVREETMPRRTIERRRDARDAAGDRRGAYGRRAVEEGSDGPTSAYRAARIRPAKERSARAGVHQGLAPLGYTRVASGAGAPVPEAGRCPRALLAPDPVYAPIVQEIFARYAAGGWSRIRLVEWLNSDPRIPPPPGRTHWICSTIHALLRNPLYCGLVRYNHRPEGRYERAGPGSEFLAPGRHPALIDRATFERVAERSAAAFTRPSYHQHEAALGAGLFVCASCGGPMTPSRQAPHLFYRCSWYQRRKGVSGAPHTAMGYAGGVAEEALLREVRRLRATPWTPGADRRLAVDDPDAPDAPDAPRALHGRLADTGASTLIDAFLARGDGAGLRLFVRGLVASVRIVERLPERQPKWLRAEVTWQPTVQALLEAGVARLAAPTPPPEQSARAERKREAQRRYSARQRQG